MRYELDPDQIVKEQTWNREHKKTCKVYNNQGAIGGRLTYTFTPTGLGIVTRVECACGEKYDLTDYECW